METFLNAPKTSKIKGFRTYPQETILEYIPLLDMLTFRMIFLDGINYGIHVLNVFIFRMSYMA